MNKLLNISKLHATAASAMLVALLAAAPAQARQLSVEEALQAACSQTSGIRRAPSQAELKLAFTARQDGLNTIYVFNRAQQGFMVVAADDVAESLLGYSENGSFDPEQMPDNLRGWLDEYSAQIAYASANGLKVLSAPARASYADVAPITKTLWDQGYPFNQFCPTDDKAQCYTGCVATAMAQVMKTYNYPAKGIGEHSYFCSNIDKTVEFNYEENPFDWANMINQYPGNAEQNKAVATLMSACGVSVNMGYGLSASGAFSANVPSALVDYFGYANSAHFSYRRYYSLPVWMDMIYNELSQGYPLYYSGQAADGSGGHAFVIDGYRSSDAFVHVNWGWSGMSDGYFRITTLEPTIQGAGGAGAGFSDMQGAIFSLRKPYEGSVVYPNITVSTDFSTRSNTYFNGQSDYVRFQGLITSTALDEITYTLGVRLVPAEGSEPIYIWKRGTNTTKTDGTVGSFDIRYTDFPTAGTYTVTPVFRYNDEIFELPVDLGKVRSLKLEASAQSLAFSPVSDEAVLSATDIVLETPLYGGMYAKFRAKVTNNGAEYFGKIVLAFTGAGNTTQQYGYIQGPAIDLTDGESEEVEFVGDVPSTILTPNTYVVVATEDGRFISEKVKLALNPKPATEAKLSFVSQKMLNTHGGRGSSARPYIVTGNPLSVEATFRCTEGVYWANYVQFFVSEAAANSAMGYPSDYLTLTNGEEATFTLNITDYSLEEGQKYKGVFGYIYTDEESGERYYAEYEGASRIYFTIRASAGIDDVVAEAEEVSVYPNPAEDVVSVKADAEITSVEAYSVSGALALSQAFAFGESSVELDVTSLAPGMYILKVNTAAGTVTSRLVKK